MGNQLYQYAFLRAAAEQTGFEIRIPAHCLRWTGRRADLRENGLAGFRIEAETHDHSISQKHSYVEREYAVYDPSVFHCEDDTDFLGYFQDYRYIRPIEATLRREFRFLAEIEDGASFLVENWRKDGRPIVAVTVRRGDYLQPGLRHRFRVPTHPELVAAMNRFQDVIYAIGSDDLPWCQEHFQGECYRFIPQSCSWTAMAVASLCDHHIISASTFSWWGAWLCTIPGKRVLYPDPWYREDRLEACCPPACRHPTGWEPLDATVGPM